MRFMYWENLGHELKSGQPRHFQFNGIEAHSDINRAKTGSARLYNRVEVRPSGSIAGFSIVLNRPVSFSSAGPICSSPVNSPGKAIGPQSDVVLEELVIRRQSARNDPLSELKFALFFALNICRDTFNLLTNGEWYLMFEFVIWIIFFFAFSRERNWISKDRVELGRTHAFHLKESLSE